MNSAQNQSLSLFILICLLVIVPVLCTAQEVPIPQNHLVNNFIERHITLGNIPQSDASVRPITYSKVRTILNYLTTKTEELSTRDKQLLRRFKSEFAVDTFESDISFPLNKHNLKNLKNSAFGKYNLEASEPHLLSYKDSAVYAWADLSETIRLEGFNDKIYRRYTDQLSILGSLSERLSFYVNFTMNRFVGDSSLVYNIEDFKNEDHPYFDFVNWTLWYQSEAMFNISTKFGNFELGKTPVIWGFSPQHSPILSGATQTFPSINYSYKFKNIGFYFLHGSLLPKESIEIHRGDNYPQKYLAAHRIELELGKDFIVSFNEMVIYGNRPFELEYLIPVNFYWPAEHNQGDRDNLLMALDCSWRVKPGLRWYNTLFWDELAWEKVFTKWWANKFVFQTGFHWASSENPLLTEIRIEATVSRPWTYTHNVEVNSYTSAGIGLGLPQGPNSQILLVKAGFWPSYRWNFNVSSTFMRAGTGLGSSPTDNYDLRDRKLDDNTPYLLGDIINSTELRIDTNYAVNRVFNVLGYASYNSLNSDISGNLGITINW